MNLLKQRTQPLAPKEHPVPYQPFGTQDTLLVYNALSGSLICLGFVLFGVLLFLCDVPFFSEPC